MGQYLLHKLFLRSDFQFVFLAFRDGMKCLRQDLQISIEKESVKAEVANNEIFAVYHNIYYQGMMEYINDYMHKRTGLNTYRQKVKMRKDLFFEYLPKEEAKDNEVMKRLANTISDVSSVCFRRCVDARYQYYTYEEESCVKNCVQNYFKGFESIVFETQSKLNQSS